MTEKLLSFLFGGILLALACKLGIGFLYQHYFPTARLFQVYWYVPFAAVPALLLLALAWGLGFYRRLGWADLVVTLILLAIVALMVPASYACGSGAPGEIGGLGCF